MINGNLAGKILVIIVSAIIALATALGSRALDRHETRLDRVEEKANICTIDNAVIKYQLSAIQTQLDRIEKLLEND